MLAATLGMCETIMCNNTHMQAKSTTCTKTHVVQRTALPPQPEHAMHQISCCAMPCLICKRISITTHAATHCMYTSVRVHCSDAHTHLQ